MVLSASGLLHYVYRRVINDPRSEQTPVYGWLRGDGDFIFRGPPVSQEHPEELANPIRSQKIVDQMAAVSKLVRIARENERGKAGQALHLLDMIARSNADELVRTLAQQGLATLNARRMMYDCCSVFFISSRN